jgi:type-F conjugative transfer system pilin assembly protein TrbC
MKNALKLSLVAATLVSALAQAQTATQSVQAADAPVITSTPQAGVNRMQAIMDGVAKGKLGGLDDATRAAINTGLSSAKTTADVDHMDARTVDFAVKESEKMEQMSREAYVAALPPRDRALGASVLLGDGTVSGEGRMYIFVSRSMPQSLLRAYAVDAFYMNASLVVKGLRRGDTLKEYLQEAMQDFNSLDGMAMAPMEINPNMFDMFDVQTVPAVVWTNRVGLDDVGSGCQNVPDGASVEKLNLEGPDDTYISVDKPSCAKLPDSSFYKMTGALEMGYVLQKFQDAGLPKDVVDTYRSKLAERTGNVLDGTVTQDLGNGMAPVSIDAKLDHLPKAVLLDIQGQMMHSNVQRGPFGPTFSNDEDDDKAYRQELTEKIRHGLGL